MSFRDLAGKETASLVDRLTAACNEEVAIVRAALDEEAAARAALDIQLHELETAHRAAVADLEARLQAAVADLEGRLHAVEQEKHAIAAALDDAKAAHALALEAEQAKHADAIAAAAATHAAALEVERAAAAAGLDAERAKAIAARAELARSADAQARADAALRHAEEGRRAALKQIEELRAAIDAKQVEAAALATELQAEAAERARLAAALRAADERAKRDRALPLDRLRTAFQRFSGCRGADQIMAALVQALAAEFSRVALFTLKAGRLEGKQQVGFEFAHDISKLVVPVQMDSLLAQAVKSGQVQGLAGAPIGDDVRALFGGDPRFAVALPLVVGGQATAVIYADDSGETNTDRAAAADRLKLAELLFWYAVPMLGWMGASASVADEAAAQ